MKRMLWLLLALAEIVLHCTGPGGHRCNDIHDSLGTHQSGVPA
jgi:hypothetical protein